ncbi:MAG: transcriptional regulator [Arthrobacter sp.]|nr:transcriptional regulator [Arthrobacter sp.]
MLLHIRKDLLVSDEESPLGSVDKALRVLDLLAEVGSEGLGLADIAQELVLNKATVHRTLAALKFRGYVSQNPQDGAYRLGSHLTTLISQYYRSENLPALMKPSLMELCSATGELVHLGVLDGSSITYIDKVEPNRAIRVWSAVGRTAAVSSTALGRAIVAFNDTDPATLQKYLPDPSTPDFSSRKEAFLNAIGQAQRYGYSLEREENEPGIVCIGFPLIYAGHPSAAISISAPVSRMEPSRIPLLAKTARDVLALTLPQGFAVPTQTGTKHA